MSLVKLTAGCMIAASLLGVGTARFAQTGGLAALAPETIGRPTPAAMHPSLGLAFPSATPQPYRGTFIALEPDRYGQYRGDIDVGGQRVSALVDTGASLVAFSYETAVRLGVAPAPADYKWQTSTANGIARVAMIEVPEIHLGPLVAHRVKAMVGERGALTGDALLGMSFLRALGGFAIRDGQLVLSQ